jgi:hypothetical protein
MVSSGLAMFIFKYIYLSRVLQHRPVGQRQRTFIAEDTFSRHFYFYFYLPLSLLRHVFERCYRIRHFFTCAFTRAGGFLWGDFLFLLFLIDRSAPLAFAFAGLRRG